VHVTCRDHMRQAIMSYPLVVSTPTCSAAPRRPLGPKQLLVGSVARDGNIAPQVALLQQSAPVARSVACCVASRASRLACQCCVWVAVSSLWLRERPLL
jgi:hypothetical protein